jgi:hypothetical protein
VIHFTAVVETKTVVYALACDGFSKILAKCSVSRRVEFVRVRKRYNAISISSVDGKVPISRYHTSAAWRQFGQAARSPF